MVTPTTTIDRRYSDAAAPATPWEDAAAILDTAGIFWLSTVRPEGGPHVTPVIAAWVDDALWFPTGDREQKARNLDLHPQVAITTGCNAFERGLDIVVEGVADVSADNAALQRVADRFASKYDWHFTVRDGTLNDDSGSPARVYCVRPRVAYGFARGTAGHTRWTFPAP